MDAKAYFIKFIFSVYIEYAIIIRNTKAHQTNADVVTDSIEYFFFLIYFFVVLFHLVHSFIYF